MDVFRLRYIENYWKNPYHHIARFHATIVTIRINNEMLDKLWLLVS